MLTIALPPLESFGSGSLLSKTAPSVDSGISNAPVKRLVTIGTYLGFHTPSWFPKETGTGYKISNVLKPLEDMRSQFSLFSGLDHRAPNGHKNWSNFLTGKGTPGISLDQIVAREVGHQSRFASLQVTCGSGGEGRMSFTKEGINLPSIGRPKCTLSKIVQLGLRQGTHGLCSIKLIAVCSIWFLMKRATLKKQVSVRDSQKLDEYFLLGSRC